MVLGATNRPNHVDSAILRRFPRQFRVKLPNEAGRLQILKLVLKRHPLAPETEKYLPNLAKETLLYSGSDLKELCHCAARESIREIVKEMARQAVMTKTKPGQTTRQEKPKTRSKLRPMSVKDLQTAKTKVKRTGQDAAEYERQKFQNKEGKKALPQDAMMQNLAALSNLMNQSPIAGMDASISGEESDEEYHDVPQI